MIGDGAGSNMESYESKRKTLFDCLEQAETLLKGSPLDQATDSNRKNRESKMQTHSGDLVKFRGKESIFKKPEMPLSKCLKPRKEPDFKINPHKWTKYSLSDVDISDHTNTSAAFNFLKEMEERNDCNSIMDVDPNQEGSQKVVFKKSSCLKQSTEKGSDDDSINKPKLRGSKLLMPEYVIGAKSTKSKKLRKPKSNLNSTSTKLTLTHLLEDEDDETI